LCAYVYAMFVHMHCSVYVALIMYIHRTFQCVYVCVSLCVYALNVYIIKSMLDTHSKQYLWPLTQHTKIESLTWPSWILCALWCASNHASCGVCLPANSVSMVSDMSLHPRHVYNFNRVEPLCNRHLRPKVISAHMHVSWCVALSVITLFGYTLLFNCVIVVEHIGFRCMHLTIVTMRNWDDKFCNNTCVQIQKLYSCYINTSSSI